MEYKYTGIILNKHDVGETDRIYTIYTLEGGKIRSLAKGVRKAHAKLASSLESLTMADVTVVKNRGMGKITGSIIENNYTKLKGDGVAMLEVFAGINLFNKLVDLESKDEQTFALLSDYLEAANQNAGTNCAEEKNTLLRLGFSLKLLELMGYKIEATFCVVCGCQFSGDRFFFSPEHGGVVCAKCAEGEQGMIMITVNTIKIIRIFFNNKMQTFGKLRVEKKEIDMLARLVQNFLLWAI